MMNLKSVFEIAEKETPKVDININKKMSRHDVINNLDGTSNIGIELGVAKGIFSKRMIESDKFDCFYGVDVYGDVHDTEQYKKALINIGLDKNYKLLK